MGDKEDVKNAGDLPRDFREVTDTSCPGREFSLSRMNLLVTDPHQGCGCPQMS